MRKFFVVVILITLLSGVGCASCKTISKTGETTMDEQIKEHGMVSWSELMTTDVKASKEFYGKLFGWTTEDISTEGMSYTIVKSEGKEIAGIMSMPTEAKGAPPSWGTYITVDDVDSTAKLAGVLGAKVMVPPRDIPNVGRFCVIQDPQGAVISAITYSCSYP